MPENGFPDTLTGAPVVVGDELPTVVVGALVVVGGALDGALVEDGGALDGTLLVVNVLAGFVVLAAVVDAVPGMHCQ